MAKLTRGGGINPEARYSDMHDLLTQSSERSNMDDEWSNLLRFFIFFYIIINVYASTPSSTFLLIT